MKQPNFKVTQHFQSAQEQERVERLRRIVDRYLKARLETGVRAADAKAEAAP